MAQALGAGHRRGGPPFRLSGWGRPFGKHIKSVEVMPMAATPPTPTPTPMMTQHSPLSQNCSRPLSGFRRNDGARRWAQRRPASSGARTHAGCESPTRGPIGWLRPRVTATRRSRTAGALSERGHLAGNPRAPARNQGGACRTAARLVWRRIPEVGSIVSDGRTQLRRATLRSVSDKGRKG